MSEKTDNEVAENSSEDHPAQPASDPTDATRRRFLATGLAVTESLIVGQSIVSGEHVPAKAPAHTNPDTSALQKRIKGQVLTASDADFEQVARDLWNKYGTMKRRPQLIVRVADEQDVVEAVSTPEPSPNASWPVSFW